MESSGWWMLGCMLLFVMWRSARGDADYYKRLYEDYRAQYDRVVDERNEAVSELIRRSRKDGLL